MTGPPAEVFGLWLHSYEEDSGSGRVYRPADHPFPPSRGRRAVELRPDGTYIEYGSGPDDRGSAVTGRWEHAGSGRVRVTVSRADGTSSTRTVTHRADGALVLE